MPPKDWAADERKLAPAYEEIQLERYKSALSIVDRHLKKSPLSQPALILRAFLLHRRGGAQGDVLKVWQSGVKAGAGDIARSSLFWSGLLLRDIKRQDLLLQLYTDMWERHPENTEHGEQIFLIAAATWDTARMVATSRKMFNLLKTAVWARVAAWSEWADKCMSTPPIDSNRSFAPPPSAGALKIAQVLLSTTRSAVPSPDALWLHLQILLGVSQLDAAIALLKTEGHGGAGLGREHWRAEAVREVFARLEAEGGKEEKIVEVARGEIEDFGAKLRGTAALQRNYGNYTYLIDCGRRAGYEGVQKLFEDLDERIGTRERSPAVALLHLDQERVDGKMDKAAWEEAVRRYWTRWGGKGVVVQDLVGVSRGREEGLVELARSWEDGAHASLDEYMRRKHATLLLLTLGAETWVASEPEFKRLWGLYVSGLQYCTDLPKTDVHPADELGLASVQVLLHLYRGGQAGAEGETLLVRAIACLRYMLNRSPCPSAQFALIRLYRMIGAPGLVAAPLDKLKLAEIQLDTMSHVFTDRGAADARAGQLGAVFDNHLEQTDAMYIRATKSLADAVRTALEHESYAGIASMRELAHVLENSVSRGVGVVEGARRAVALAATATAGSTSREVLTAQEVERLREMAQRVVWEDGRNWELCEVYVGKLSAEEMFGAWLEGGDGQGKGKKVDGAWVRCWAGVLLRVASVEGGAAVGEKEVEGRVSELVVPPSTNEEERAALGIVTAVLDLLEKSVAKTEAVGLDTTVRDSLSALSALIGGENRVQALHACSAIAEVRDILRVIVARLAPAVPAGGAGGAGGAGKGKKKAAASVGGGAGAADEAKRRSEAVQVVVSRVEGAFKEAAGMLGKDVDDEARWEGEEWVGETEKDFGLAVIKDVRAARARAFEVVKGL